jgi:hypothetical protein
MTVAPWIVDTNPQWGEQIPLGTILVSTDQPSTGRIRRPRRRCSRDRRSPRRRLPPYSIVTPVPLHDILRQSSETSRSSQATLRHRWVRAFRRKSADEGALVFAAARRVSSLQGLENVTAIAIDLSEDGAPAEDRHGSRGQIGTPLRLRSAEAKAPGCCGAVDVADRGGEPVINGRSQSAL